MSGAHLDPLERLDRRLRRIVPGAVTPGAVALIACGGEPVFHRAYGWAQTHDERGPLDPPRPMRTDTTFDVASITKAFTTAAVMRLVDEGELTLDRAAGDLLPDLDAPPVTVDRLLTHRSGLTAWYPVYLHARRRDDALDWVCRHGPRDRPGRARRYSDLGFVVLGGIVEQVAGARLDVVLAREIFAPLAMSSTCFTPAGERRGEIAATSTGNRTEQRMIAVGDPTPVDAAPEDFPHWRRHTLVGEVQDGNAAYAFEGVAGSAGAFSTAADLAAFGHALSAAFHGAAGVWRRSTVERFLREPDDRGQGRGWWTRRCRWGGREIGFGHAGFTGCELVVVPEVDAVAVLLTNRLHTERDPPPDHSGLWRHVVDALRAQAGP